MMAALSVDLASSMARAIRSTESAAWKIRRLGSVLACFWYVAATSRPICGMGICGWYRPKASMYLPASFTFFQKSG